MIYFTFQDCSGRLSLVFQDCVLARLLILFRRLKLFTDEHFVTSECQIPLQTFR